MKVPRLNQRKLNVMDVLTHFVQSVDGDVPWKACLHSHC